MAAARPRARAWKARGIGLALRRYCYGMTEKSKREAPISYRPPQELRAQFRARVEESGLSVNAFITAAVFGEDAPAPARRVSASRADIARLLAQTALLGAQLKGLGPDADDALVAEAIRDLHEIRAACLKTLGRSP
ncbi:hypothetical protein Xaut_0543 [Xanthobacter versatilis]|uniref:Uncharacterized protein n=1 Tax=Xanthobacter autotrophicus (strain ATCC BAA-1158 / Py2) TaxID=78245 RepID=A7ICQ6_XANP2|nr:hypothetical protein Xaut_0543 [Xanthobacter autotrophicus Py2]